MSLFFYTNVTLFIATFIICFILIITQNWHKSLTLDSFDGDQKFHTSPTIRIGGVGIFIGFLISLNFIYSQSLHIWFLTIVASLPCFLIGLLEDFSKAISPKVRILAIFSSGILFCFLTGYSLNTIDIIFFDFFLSISFFSIIFTAFAITGVANSINIIDGFNGLASGTLIIIFFGFSLVCQSTSDFELFYICIISASIIFGFYVLNFPFGKIFLGDAGAYFLGYILSAIAILLPLRNPEISPWVSFLLCSYPITETFFSILRKSLRKGHSPSQPDKVHLHMLIHKRLTPKISKKLKLDGYKNSLTGFLMTGFSLLSLILTYLSLLLEYKQFYFYLLFIVLYLMIYFKVSLLNLKVKSIAIRVKK